MTAGQQVSSRDRHLFGPGPKRVLALDGGGVRGILSVAMLEKLEKVIEQIEGRSVLLGDWFDLIGGTSTGAIIAGLLALGYRAADVRELYEKMVPRVFKASRWRLAGFRSKFDSRNLETVLTEVFRDRTIGSEEVRTGLCVTTKRLDTGSAWIIANNPRSMYWDTPSDNSFTGNRHYRLANLIRASTAAPHYFEPQRIEIAPNTPPGLFIDGGVSPNNNPSLHMFLIATLPQYGLCWPTGPDNLTIVSMGTGSFRFRMNPNVPALARYVGMTIQALASQISDSQQLVLAMMSLFGETPMAWPINSELGDLGATPAPGGRPLFRFLRYDVRLEQAWLRNELGLSIEEPKLTELQQLDAADALAQFYDLGVRAAERQIQPAHFAAPPPRS